MGESEGFADRILSCVESIPAGRVMTYKDVAEFAGMFLERLDATGRDPG